MNHLILVLILGSGDPRWMDGWLDGLMVGWIDGWMDFKHVFAFYVFFIFTFLCYFSQECKHPNCGLVVFSGVKSVARSVVLVPSVLESSQ